ISSHTKGYPFEVAIPKGFKIKGVILSDQVKSLDWRIRGARFVCRLPRSVLVETIQKIGALLGIELS
ncbi:MAG: type II toxin-antitoxin system PemK/MazF family toxin, partial [bacterium]